MWVSFVRVMWTSSMPSISGQSDGADPAAGPASAVRDRRDLHVHVDRDGAPTGR
jgi:hypothetical protein